MAQLTASIPLRVSDVAGRLGVTSAAVRKWINLGLGGERLRATRAGPTGMFFIEQSDLNNFLRTTEKYPDEADQ